MNEMNTYDHIGHFSGLGLPNDFSPVINIRASVFGGFNTFGESLSHSPQESIGSERWTPSPLETASPSRSSPSYGTSPYDFGVDIFLDNIRQPGNGLPRDIESVPANDTQNHQDRDCTNLNSEIAAKIPDTNSDNKVDEPLVTSSAVVPSSSQMVQYSNPSAPTQCESDYCGTSENTPVFYCHSCNQILCSICKIYHGNNHTIMDLIDASKLADIRSNKILSDIQFYVAKQQENLCSAQRAAQNLEYNAAKAKEDVSFSIEQAKIALQKREQELYAQIDHAKNKKFQFLQFQEHNFENTIKQLSTAAKELTDAMNLSNVIQNPAIFFRAEAKAFTQISDNESRWFLSTSVRNERISFSVTTDKVFSEISYFGRIKLNSFGFIGEGRPLKGRGNSLCSFQPGAPGRPIPSINRAVIVDIQDYLSPPEMRFQIGFIKDKPNIFPRPWGVACDEDGNIIATDRTHNYIKIFNQNGKLLRTFGTEGEKPGELKRPAGVAVDKWKRILVVDKDNHRVQIFTMEGEFMLKFGNHGKKNGEFDYPWDVATNTDCEIVISDPLNRRIQLFNPYGVFLRKFSCEHENPSKLLDSPRGVAFNPQGDIVVTDFNLHHIVVIKYNMIDYKIIDSEYTQPPKKFFRLQGITIDDEGNMIVCDSRNNRIQVLDSEGNLKYKFGGLETGPQLKTPAGITLTPDGRIVVVDFDHERIVVY